MAREGGWIVGLGAGAVLCAGVGVAVGREAAGHVDGFYTAPRVRAERPMPVVREAGWDWNESASLPTEVPASGAVWLDGGGRGNGGDGATLTEVDRAVERAAPVRVHRGRRAATRPAVERSAPGVEDEAAVLPAA